MSASQRITKYDRDRYRNTVSMRIARNVHDVMARCPVTTDAAWKLLYEEAMPQGHLDMIQQIQESYQMIGKHYEFKLFIPYADDTAKNDDSYTYRGHMSIELDNRGEYPKNYVTLPPVHPFYKPLLSWYREARDITKAASRANSNADYLLTRLSTTGQLYRALPELAQILFSESTLQELKNNTLRRSPLPETIKTEEWRDNMHEINTLMARGALLGRVDTTMYAKLHLNRMRRNA